MRARKEKPRRTGAELNMNNKDTETMVDNTDGLDIPDFLRRQPGEAPAPRIREPKIKVRKTKARAKKHPFHLPKNMEPAGWALLKQIEAEKKAKRDARFAMLRDLKTRKR